LLAKQALKPVSEIMTQVSAISGSNLDARISEGNGKDELSRLAMTFNKMLDRIEAGINTQKSFITNASHELRTPLTAITLQLDVILMNARSNEEYRNTLLSVLADMRNLNLIANRLLLLAQASSEINESSFIQLRIDDLLWQARKEIIRRDPGYRISVSFSESIDNDRKLIVRGSELLLKTAVGNLMENSCKYSGNQTSEIFLDSIGDNLCIRFSDTGIGIPTEDLDNIFQPFYRARNAISYKGHGIGLSLAQTIIHQHRGTIEVHSELNSGTVFQICLKSSG
jgi:signal transduction histidine kinase